jgi:hypothetical protein
MRMSESDLGKRMESFNRLVGGDLARQEQRTAGIRSLVNDNGWLQRDAEEIFRESGRSYDILSGASSQEVLSHPYYRATLNRMGGVAEGGPVDERIAEQVSHAREVALDAGRTRSSASILEANRLFSEQLKEMSRKNPESSFVNTLMSEFGVRKLGLGSMVSDSFMSALREEISSKEVETAMRVTPWAAKSAFMQNLQMSLGARGMSEAENLYAQSAFSLKLGNESQWESLANRLPTEVITHGSTAYNAKAWKSLVKSGFEAFSNEFTVPVTPGFGGMMPFKFMPWARGDVKDFAGTLGAGTFQREMMEALPPHLRDTMFTEEGRLRRDAYHVGESVFLTMEDHTAYALPSKWKIKDSRFGFQSAFRRLRETGMSEPPRESLIFNLINRFTGASGLQGEERSKLSKFMSVIDRNINPQAYPEHPLTALENILNGSREGDSIENIERVLHGVRGHARIDSSINMSDLISEHIRSQVNIGTGLERLLNENFADRSVLSATREIDKAMSGQPPTGYEQYFSESEMRSLRGSHTRMTARRLAQSDVEYMSQPDFSGSPEKVLSLKNLLGEKTPVSGYDRLRDIFHGEVLRSIVTNPNFSSIRGELLKNASRIKGEKGERALVRIWQAMAESELFASYSLQPSQATALAAEIRGNPELRDALKSTLGKNFGRNSVWHGVTSELLEGSGAIPYATPRSGSLIGMLRNSFERRSVSKLTDIPSLIARGNTIASPGLLLGREEGVPHGTVSSALSYLFGTNTSGGPVTPGALYHSGYRMNRMLAEFGIGLSPHDMQNTTDLYKSLLFKRVLPAYIGVEYWKYLNHVSDKHTGLSPDKGVANLRAWSALGGSKLADTLHLSGLEKRIVDIIPGLEDYWQPRTYKEQKDYLAHGYEPVRRGKGWFGGSRTAFTGNRVQWWSPSWYQKEMSGWQDTKEAALNSDSYWSHSLLPTPTHPLSPLWHFLDPYWWENQHKKDRPYVTSGPAFDPNTIWGNVLNATIGRILKPTRVYHPEYLEGNSSDVAPTPIRASRGSRVKTYANFTQSGAYSLTAGYPSDIMEGVSATPVTGGSSGLGRHGGHAAREAVARINAGIKGGHGNVEAALAMVGAKVPIKSGILSSHTLSKLPISPTNPLLQTRRLAEQYWDISGIYGYGIRTISEALGVRQSAISNPILATPDRAYGLERRLWERNLGGTILPGVPIGGDVSEFIRRVIPHKDRTVNYYDPVPNTMPGWLPGSDYMTNFREGDPYALIQSGELRLPGEAYSKLHGNKGYSAIDRVNILSDVAPWSDEFKIAVAQARVVANSEDANRGKTDRALIRNAIHRASVSKKLYELHDYKFNRGTHTERLTIKKVMDANTFMVKESSHPIRLAGVRVSQDRIRKYLRNNNLKVPKGDNLLSYFYGLNGLSPGSKIKAVMNRDDQVANDLLQTRHAAVIANGRNVNLDLLRSGVGRELVNDNSASGIAARFSGPERFAGSVFEKLAHLDTPFNTKFWHVRSALEEYKRGQVYGTNSGDWGSPYRSWIRPTMNAMAARNPVLATAEGAFIGSLFGRTQRGKLIGATIGALLGGESSLRRVAGEMITGKKYIPRDVKRRRELEEYYDTLKYLKYSRLYHQYAMEAREREGSNIPEIISTMEAKGARFKKEFQRQMDGRREILLSNMSDSSKEKLNKKLIRDVNKLIRLNRSHYRVGPLGARAMMYHQMARHTLIGSKAGAPLNDAMAGLPRYERELAMDIAVNGTAQEKREFYSLLSNREKSALGSSLGVKSSDIPGKISLEDYFRSHQLPNESWTGWLESVDLNNPRIMTAAYEKINPQDLGIYPQNESQARLESVGVPTPLIHGTSTNIRETLERLLSGVGVSDLNVNVSISSNDDSSESDTEVELRRDITHHIVQKALKSLV